MYYTYYITNQSVLQQKGEQMYELKTCKNCHAQYRLEYHLVLVTKYRKACITEDMFQFLKAETVRIFALNEVELLEMNYEPDHVHLLFSAPPQVQLSKIINSYKSATSRHLRKNYAEHLAGFYYKPYFWSRSYLILSSGGAPIEVIRRYIQNQKGG